MLRYLGEDCQLEPSEERLRQDGERFDPVPCEPGLGHRVVVGQEELLVFLPVDVRHLPPHEVHVLRATVTTQHTSTLTETERLIDFYSENVRECLVIVPKCHVTTTQSQMKSQAVWCVTVPCDDYSGGWWPY